jgi:hypothetical protein
MRGIDRKSPFQTSPTVIVHVYTRENDSNLPRFATFLLMMRCDARILDIWSSHHMWRINSSNVAQLFFGACVRRLRLCPHLYCTHALVLVQYSSKRGSRQVYSCVKQQPPALFTWSTRSLQTLYAFSTARRAFPLLWTCVKYVLWFPLLD